MRTAHLILLLLLLTSGCRKEEFDIRNLNGGRIIAQGHGGMGIHSLYPLDSPASVLACLHSGADGSEIDVQMTRDSVLIAYHSADLSTATDMSGPVVAYTWAELSEALFIGPTYTEHHLMCLDDLLSNLDDPRRYMFSLDLKPHPVGMDEAVYDEQFANALVELLRRHALVDRVFVESQQPYLLGLLRTKEPDLKLMIYPPTFEEGYATAMAMGLFGISIDIGRIDAAQVEQAHASGIWIAIWNATSRSLNRDAVKLNPEIIQTDRLDHLLDLLD